MGQKHKVAIIGCGRLGQQYATVYSTLPNTEIVAIAEFNEDRRKAVGERFGVKELYPDAESLLKDIVPDIAAVVTPTKWMKESVIACAQAGVKGVSTDKPIAARLSDAHEMVEVCKSLGVVFAGGNMPRAHHHVQEAAKWLREGKFGNIQGALINGMSGRISGGGIQAISVIRLFMNAEVDELICWGSPENAVYSDNDNMKSNGIFTMSNGIQVSIFGDHILGEENKMIIDVWTEDSLLRWFWKDVEIYKGFDCSGKRKLSPVEFTDWPWKQFNYLASSIRSLISAVEKGTKLAISGYDLRQGLEVAIAMKLSAQLGNVPIKLPLSDRSLTLMPEIYRWIGGDNTGTIQSSDEAKQQWSGYEK